jgi:predicted HTH transcriptional regulator
MAMKQEKHISFRVPEATYNAIVSLAESRGVSVSKMLKETLASLSVTIELERNKEYHRKVLKALDEIEKKVTSKRTNKAEKIITSNMKSLKTASKTP